MFDTQPLEGEYELELISSPGIKIEYVVESGLGKMKRRYFLLILDDAPCNWNDIIKLKRINRD